MTEKIKLFDTSKCTGCRSCQLACKQWNQLAAKQTRNTGTYQNPPDLQPNTYLVMRFQEMEDSKRRSQVVLPASCLHALHRCGMREGVPVRSPLLY